MRTFFFTLLGVGTGLALIIYTRQARELVGSIDFAEKYLGMGGTYTFLKFFGIFLIVFTLMWATGTVDRLLPDFLFGAGNVPG